MTTLQNAIALFSSGQYRAAMDNAAQELPALLDLAAVCAYQQADKENAERYWRIAVGIQPAFERAFNNIGLLCADRGDLRGAEAAFRQALAIRADYAEALHNLGAILVKLDELEEAEALCRQAIAARPDDVESLNNWGVALAKLDRLEEAEAICSRALAARPSHAETHFNLGNLLKTAGRLTEAEAAYRQALALNPAYIDAGLNLTWLLLSQGRFREAWPLHEWRYHSARPQRGTISPNLPFPQWQGEDLRGKRILVWYEQGFGDEIQFCRLVPLLKARAAHVGWVCKPPLVPLLKTLEGLDAVYSADALPDLGAYDFWTFPLSIPLHLGLGLDNPRARLPYLSALPERIADWRNRLPQGRLRVGLVWKGFAGHGNDARRSLAGLAQLKPLWSVPGLAFVSLQKDAGEDEAQQPPPGQELTALGAEINDFADTAAIITQLDLLICVDTAAAHLAGALGKPCWVLLPGFQPDWRWLLGREDSPWYPQVMRLFRQGKSEPWEAVIQRVAEALREWKENVGEVSNRD